MVAMVNLPLTTSGIAPFIVVQNDLSAERIRLSTWLQM